jgi:UDP-3-O-[3-hydroxymyristoyl] glucosamine N-acyltransferase
MPEIADTALISPDATLGRGVAIGHATTIHAGTVVGDGTTIGDFCSIGHPAAAAKGPARIGTGSTIRSHSVIYAGAELGERFECGHHVLVRAGARTGVNARVGSYSSLEGELEIGDYFRMQGHCEIGPGTRIADFVWIFPQVVCTNDPLPPSHVLAPVTVGSGAAICTAAVLLPGCRLGEGAFVAAGAHVAGEVPAGRVVLPTGELGGHVSTLLHFASGTRHPWMRHFTDQFPDDARERIAALLERVEAARAGRTA